VHHPGPDAATQGRAARWRAGYLRRAPNIIATVATLLGTLTLAEALLPHLAEGSMRPKIESALGFAGETLITNIDSLAGALARNAGTRVRP